MGSIPKIFGPHRIHSYRTLTTRTKRISSSETVSVSIFTMRISKVAMTFQVVVNLEYFAKECPRVGIYVDLIEPVRMDYLFHQLNRVTGCLTPKKVSVIYHWAGI